MKRNYCFVTTQETQLDQDLYCIEFIQKNCIKDLSDVMCMNLMV